MEAIEGFAQLILNKYNLVPPVDIHNVLKRYAKVIPKVIPVSGVDGVCLNINNSSKDTIVIYDETMGNSRTRFTLAHELGHIIIPWHVGEIIADNISNGFESFHNPLEHQTMEMEANRFASEILMPGEWVNNILEANKDLSIVHSQIRELAQVSVMASAIKMCSVTKRSIAFCIVNNLDIVTNFGKSRSSSLMQIQSGSAYHDSIYEEITDKYESNIAGERYVWFETSIKEPEEDNNYNTDWKFVLNEMIDDLNIDDVLSYKRSLSGVIGSANSNCMVRHPPPSFSKLYTIALQRLNRPEFKSLYEHSKFKEFLWVRLREIANKY